MDVVTPPGPGRSLRRLIRACAPWRVYLVVGALVTAAYLFLLDGLAQDFLYEAFALTAAGTLVLAARRRRHLGRGPWLPFAAGTLLFVAGDVTLLAYEDVFAREIPFPSLADAFYLAAYPTLGLGLVRLIRERASGGDRAGLIDSGIMVIGMGVLSWVFLMTPYAHDNALALGPKLISIAYPLMDLMLLGLVARLAVAPGARPASFHLLAASMLVLLAADSAYGVTIATGTFVAGGPVDAVFLAFYVLWGAAALHPSLDALAERAPVAEARLTPLRLAALAAACLVAPVVLTVQAVRGQTSDVAVVATAAAVLFLLAILRMSGLVRSVEAALDKHRRAVERERILRRAAAGLVATTERSAVLQTTLEAARALTAGVGGATARMVTDRAELETAAAAAGAAAGGPHLLTVPLLVRDEVDCGIALGSDEPLDEDVRNGVEMLAAQTALALETAALAESLVLRQAESRLSALVQHSSDVITIVGGGNEIQYVSPSAERVLGYRPQELTGRELSDLIHPDDRARVLRFLTDMVTGAHSDVSLDFRMRHRDGAWRHTESALSNLLDDPGVQGLVFNTRDVSERRALEEKLAHQAFHDALTGLPNRVLLLNRLEHALSRRRRDLESLAVLFLDLDDFKNVNDSLGHAAGDQLLVEASRRLMSCLRPEDTIARLGGDEFAILIDPDGSLSEATGLAARILGVLGEPFELEGAQTFVSASIGIAECAPGQEADEVLRNADTAMYLAKSESKGAFVVFEQTMHETLSRRLELSADLRRAVSHDELVLHFQPILGLGQERLVSGEGTVSPPEIQGVEALVRWEHPRRGLIPPSEFIPLAEETGLIVPLGRWVLDEACRRAAGWPTVDGAAELTVSVNVSARQLQDAEIIADVVGALAASGLDPRRLVLEITESALMKDTAGVIRRLEELKALGVQIAIDDFGTGYSSLSYLERFPVDKLKIDKAFVDKLALGDDAASLASAIVRLGESLRLVTVAEGVETAGQVDALRTLGCDMVQGFFLGRPIDADAFDAVLRGRSGDGPDPLAGLLQPGISSTPGSGSMTARESVTPNTTPRMEQ